MTGGKSVVSRRKFVATLAGGAIVACAAGVERARALTGRGSLHTQPVSGSGSSEVKSAPDAAPAAAEVAAPPAPPPWELLSPLAIGAAVTPAWRVAGLTEVVDGSCVLTLENERGRTQRVHLCRNDGRPQGIVHTSGLDLVVMNGGLGDLPTEEGFAQAVAEVAHVLAVNEARHEGVVSTLLPHAERIERFASAAQLR
jgi:hypothetical protein